MNKIVIIGSGFSGTLTAIQLMRHQTDLMLDITLIERAGFGRGIAYSTPFAHHLLNVPAGKMSCLPDEPEHFLNWLHDKNPDSQETDFISRQRFGDYLNHCLDQAEQARPATTHFQKIDQEAIAIHPSGESYVIALEDGSSLSADRVVLALGNSSNAIPNFPQSPFYHSERFIANPWLTEELLRIPPEADLFIIGTGLTMIDKVLQLKAQNHRGKIIALSRKGLLPQAHDLTCLPILQPLGKHPTPSVRELFRQFRIVLAQGENNWRSLVDGLRPQTQQLWQSLPKAEKERFLRHVRPYWESHRHRMAPEIATQIERFIETKQLEILAGRILAYQESDDRVEVIIQPRKQAEPIRLQVDYVLNCSGSGANFLQRTDALVVNLIQNGLIVPDCLGMGLNCLPNGCLLNRESATSNLYTLGPPMKGLLWESTAVPEIRQQAKTLAETLVNSLTPHNQMAQAGHKSR